jgi:tetratricopeptide (TPR) repeat protein
VNPRGALFDPARWALVYRAADGLVFVRRGAQVKLPEIPLTFSYSAADGLLPVPLASRPDGVEVSPCEWQRRLGDYHRSASQPAAALAAYQSALSSESEASCQQETRAAAGAVALGMGDFSRAAAFLAGLAAPAVRTNHGFALLGLGRAADALADFEAVFLADERNDEATFGRGMCLAALGRAEEADAAFAALLARSPNHVSAASAREQRARLRLVPGKR